MTKKRGAKKPKYVIQQYYTPLCLDWEEDVGRWFGIIRTRDTKEVARFRKPEWAKEFIRRHA